MSDEQLREQEFERMSLLAGSALVVAIEGNWHQLGFSCYEECSDALAAWIRRDSASRLVWPDLFEDD